MDEPLEELYFNWLYSKVARIDVPSTPGITYLTLMRALHNTEFVWMLIGDSNRAEEGLELRNDFYRESGEEQDPSWLGMPCSCLEMLYAFAIRASAQTESSAHYWFWYFLEALGIGELSDNHVGISQHAGEALETFLWRTYDSEGFGGLFPLPDTNSNQKDVELWYQFCEYVLENDVV